MKLRFPSYSRLGLGRTSLERHVIEVMNEVIPVKQRHYPVSPAIQKLLFDELDRMIALGNIELSNSSWSSPVTLVRKETKNRVCLDARKVNARTIKDAYPLLHIEGIQTGYKTRSLYPLLTFRMPFGRFLWRKSQGKRQHSRYLGGHCINLR